ncbi:MAG: alpha-amylase family glycosyl hydrolase, partial [Ruminococcus sp.]
MKKGLLKVLSLLVTLCLLVGCTAMANAVTVDKESTGETEVSTLNLQENTQDGVILHAFCWSYDTIKDNLSAIAEAGYSTIQTSPVQQPKNYGHWYDVTGQYWKLYQPLTYSIATESWLGTKEDLTELCTEAHKYGIKIICDVVMNHLGNDTNGTTGTLYDGLADTLPEIYNDYKENYNITNADKLKYLHFCTNNANDSNLQSITQGYVNNLISLNTGSEYIQELATGLLKECVDCGVDGFRFDAAKHIETPDDGEFASDYWPNVLGAASEYAKTTQNGKELFYYGEILNSVGTGRNVESYTKYMSVTDNREGDSVTGYVYKGSAQSASNVMKNNGTGSFIGAAADKTVLWAESHDTYLGTSGAGGLSSTKNVSNEVIMKSWALNASRKDATSLYFARPGVLMSEVGDLSWKSTAVSEVNKFHNKFVGESESIGYSGDLAYNQRGTTGIVIVNCNGNETDVNISGTTMADGQYIDTVTGNQFTVENGTVSGKMGNTGIAVVYDGAVSPKITVSKGNTSFKGESFTFTATAENAESATYQMGESEPVPFTGTTEITVGTGYEYGAKIPVKLTAQKGELVSTVTYYYEKLKPADTGLYVYFDNSKAQYDEVYCYAFDRYNNDDNYSINNRSWPGEKMEYDSETGLYYYEIPDVSGTVTVPDGEGTKDVELSLTKGDTAGAIFTDGKGKQYPGQASKKLL